MDMDGKFYIHVKPANRSFAFARWYHKTDVLAAICNCMFSLEVDPKSLLKARPVGTPSDTACHGWAK